MHLARGSGAAVVTFLLLSSLLLGAGGCLGGSVSPPPEPGGTSPDAERYVIGVPDLLSVRVWKHPDLSVDAPVRRDGKISIPLLDDVQAAGETPESLAENIQEELAAFVSRPNVTVVVLSPDSQQVTVVGGVVESGEVPLRRDMGVLEAIAGAGGFTAWANKSQVRVIRSVDGARQSYRFDYRAYLSGEPNSDIVLRPGDVIVVPE